MEDKLTYFNAYTNENVFLSLGTADYEGTENLLT